MHVLVKMRVVGEACPKYRKNPTVCLLVSPYFVHKQHLRCYKRVPEITLRKIRNPVVNNNYFLLRR